jgi:hypothetical protein
MTYGSLHRRVDKSLESNRELLTEVEKVLGVSTPDKPLRPELKRALFEGIATFRDRLMVVLGELSQLALSQRESIGVHERELAAFTAPDRDLVQLYRPSVVIGKQLMEGQESRLSTGKWGARKYAQHLEQLSGSVPSLREAGFDLNALPHVRQILHDAIVHWRAELAHVMEEKNVEGDKRYGGAHRSYDALFTSVTSVIHSLLPKQQPDSLRGFNKSRDWKQGERLVPGSGHSNFPRH